MKKVTVVMPTYKRDHLYVQRAMESLLSQTYKNIEIIVIDDSPDDYPHRNEVKQYMESLNCPYLIYHQNPENLGGSLARNVGIYKATGDYITFLDDDDKYLPDKIKNQVEFMDAHDYDMTFSNMLIKTMSETLIDVRDYHNVHSFEQEEFLKYHLMRHATGTPTFMYRADKLKEIGGFIKARMGQEFLLMLKTIEAGLKIGYLDKYDVVVYRHKDEAISTGMNKIIGERELYQLKKKYFPRLSKDQQRFIKMRHYAVLAVAYKRNKKYYGLFYYSIVAFLCAPKYFIKEGIKFVKKVVEQRKIYNKNNP